MSQERRFTAATTIGLLIAFLALPAITFLFRTLLDTSSPPVVVARELTLFASAALLLMMMKRDGMTLQSIGIGTAPIGRSLLRSLLYTLACIVALAIALALIHLLGLTYGSGGSGLQLPVWTSLLVIVRAGVVEELFYRGYAIERLQSLLGNRWLACLIPLAIFALGHYRQGVAGIIIALLTGAVLTYAYVWKRDLVANMIAHFTVDFVPNILLPLFE